MNVCISHTEIRQCYIRVILFRDAHASFDLQDFINQEQDGSELIITTQPDGQKWLFSSGRRMIIRTLNLLLNLTNPDKSSTAFVIFVYFKRKCLGVYGVFSGQCKKCSLPSQAYSGPLDFINRFYCVSGGNVKSDLIVSVMEKTHIKEHLSLTKCMIWGIVIFIAYTMQDDWNTTFWIIANIKIGLFLFDVMFLHCVYGLVPNNFSEFINHLF